VTLRRVPMPPADGAPFPCNLVIERPSPIFWDTCGEPAVEAWQPDQLADAGGAFLQLRCPAHREAASEDDTRRLGE
jgi:hypothetical protein